MPRRKRIAVFATEPVTGQIGGLGIRQLHVARTLHKHCDVRLLTPFVISPHREKFPLEQITYEDAGTFARHGRWADAVYATSLSVIPIAQQFNRPLIVDLLVPEYFENLEDMPLETFPSQEKSDRFANSISRLTRLLTAGDFFLCPNEKTRDYYLGMLTQLGRLRPHDYANDRKFRQLIDVCPFGIPRREPRNGKTLFRNKIEGIGDKDFLIVWGGSLANWFDSLTPVKAMAHLKKRLPRAKLVFTGKKHPVWGKLPKACQEVVDLATSKGIFNKSVFMYTDWVPYDQHEYYLSEADAGISTFHDHIENDFCFRIRVTDYLWGNLPILTNPGNIQSEQIASQNLGKVVPFGDHRALADAIEWMATHPKALQAMRQNIAREKKHLYWDRVLRPLVQFCKEPRKSSSLFEANGIPQERKKNSFSYQPGKFVEVMPDHPHILLEKARQHFDRGDHVEGVQCLKDHIELFGAGLSSHLFRQPLFALETEFDFRELAEWLTDHPHYLLLRAKLALDEDDFEQAQEFIDEEISLFGETLESQFLQGLLYQARGKHRKALPLFEAVAEAMPGHLAFQLPVAETLVGLKHTPRARGIFVRVWRESLSGPHSGEEWLRARAAVAISELDRDKRPALETLMRYFNRDRTNETLANILCNRIEETGHRLMEQGRDTEARKLYRRAWRRRGDSVGEGRIRVNAALALARLETGRRPELETLNRFMTEEPENEQLAYAIASSLERTGKRAEARALFERCTESFKAKSMLGSAWYRLALLSEEAQQKQMIERCLALYPSHRAARELWSRLEGRENKDCASSGSLKV